MTNQNLDTLNVNILNYTSIYNEGIQRTLIPLDASGVGRGHKMCLNNLAIVSAVQDVFDISGATRMRGTLEASGAIQIKGRVTINNAVFDDNVTFSRELYINDVSNVIVLFCSGVISCEDITAAGTSISATHNMYSVDGKFNQINVETVDMSGNLNVGGVSIILPADGKLASYADLDVEVGRAKLKEQKNSDAVVDVSGVVSTNKSINDASNNNLVTDISGEITRAIQEEQKNEGAFVAISAVVSNNKSINDVSNTALNTEVNAASDAVFPENSATIITLNGYIANYFGYAAQIAAKGVLITNASNNHAQKEVEYNNVTAAALPPPYTVPTVNYTTTMNAVNKNNDQTTITTNTNAFGVSVETLKNSSTLLDWYINNTSSNSTGGTSSFAPIFSGNTKVTGRIFIGTNTTQPICPLRVGGPASYALFNKIYMYMDSNNAVGVEYSYSSKPISIATDGWAVGSGLMVHSDRRIKENITDVDDNVALQQLRNIPCRFYEYKDKITSGFGKTIGFIAQEVMEQLPMAVSLQTSIIPDEMRTINNPQWSVDSGKHKLTIPDLDNSGNTLYRFYVRNDSMEIRKDIMSLENDPKSFIFDASYSNVFIYGKKVDDFHTIDKQKIFALNFSATQEIDRIQQTSIAKISALETENVKLKAELTAVETTLTALEANI